MNEVAPEPDRPELPETAGMELFEHFKAAYLEPEVRRRIEADELEEGSAVYLAQAVFRLGQPPEIRLNDEVQGEMQAEAVGPIEKGQLVGAADMKRVTAYRLPEE